MGDDVLQIIKKIINIDNKNSIFIIRGLNSNYI